MKRYIFLILVSLLALPLAAAITSFKFRSTPLPEALGRIARAFPETRINFIYNRLEDYKVNADVNARTSIEAVRQTLERLPVKGIERGGKIYVEALREGGYKYSGIAVDPSGEAVPFASVLLLSPADSTVVTYGTTSDNGSFSIPCPLPSVIAKIKRGLQDALRPFRLREGRESGGRASANQPQIGNRRG